ncbi:hypothetical protein NW766_009574 [Fusarium irregulare]|uniref:Heterokaryon incompatibility protein n=1 Tax=Fusarium irregulare TaxID=2494466 RepID=A0A9W8U724_9HYPO|nr:hypothetical protein NW766_009574 [Fusarium irregulare]
MASIYENAQITLAGEPSDHSQGLFHGCRDYTSLDIPGLHGDSEVPFVEMRRRLKSRLDCHLLSRGWVFQEIQLSRRYVYFAPNEIVWDCFSESWCECGGVYESSGYVKILPRIGENCDANDQLLSWSGHDGIVERFTQLDLTKPEDRLPALAGLASRYHFHNGNLTYAAGLWLEDLPSGGLFWTTRGKPAPRPKELFTPTWSWASVTTPVQFRFMSEHDQLQIKVRELNVVTVEGGNPYGRLQKAHLLVEGVLGYGWLLGYRKNAAMFSDFAGLVRANGIDEIIPFAADYDFRAKSDYQVSMPCMVYFLFGYCTDLSNRPGRKVSKPYYPGGIVLREISQEPFLFEKIGLFDAFTLASKEDDSVQFDIGESYVKLLEKTGSRVTDIMII